MVLIAAKECVLAKKSTEALIKLRSENGNAGGRQGIGYFVPASTSKNEWKKLKRIWDKKLRNSNFDDIEQFSPDCTGHFSPFFTKTVGNNSVWGSSASVARQYDSSTLEYYRRVGIFLNHAPLWKLFGCGKGGHQHYWRVWHILKLTSEGATYQAIANFFKSKKCPPSIRGKKSYFFAYHHLERPTNKRAINRIMAKWWSENREWLEE